MGDFTLGDTVDCKFTTRRFTTGAPHTLAGTPVVSAYPDNSTTQITAGITLSVDFDSVTGLNNVRVVASGGNGYAAGSTYYLVITTGTVDSVSVVGEVIGSFSLSRSAAYTRLGAPAGASVSADVASIKTDTGTTIPGRLPAALVGGRIDANVGAISSDATAADNLEAALDGTGGVTITAALTGNVTGNLSGSVGSVTGNVGGNVTGSVGSLAAQAKADVNAEVDSALDTAIPGSPTANSVNERLKTMDDADIPGRLPAALSGGRMSADVGAISTDATAADTLESLLDGGGGTLTANITGSLSGSVGSLTTNNDKTGYRLSATGVDDVWDEATAGHAGAGTTGKALTDAAAAGAAADPWATALPAAYSAGTAGNILGNRLDVAVSSVAGGGAGSGSEEIVDTVYDLDGTTPLGDVDVYYSTDAAMTNIVASGKTDAFGVVQPHPQLDAGTYYRRRQKAGKNFTNPTTLTVT